MKTIDWNLKEAPSLKGKVAIVTGANTGLGYETAKALASKQAAVFLACRSREKAEAAISDIKKNDPDANLSFIELNLGDLSSVKEAAFAFLESNKKLDILVNNAGVMMPPFQKTKDGFELQFGVNYLGHFLFTKLLFEALKVSEQARIVQLASLAHRWGDIYFEDPNFDKQKYDRQKSYGQSKLACLIFGYELQRRLESSGSSIKSMAAHPGISDTELVRYLPGWMKFLSPVFNSLIAQSARAGAQPTLRAALDNSLKGGEYLGPNGFGEMKGKPVVVDSSMSSKSKTKAQKLWQLSEQLLGEEFKV